ncbi:hypothetical protein CHS0354_012115 [Potamilus streckersoni]|uniref:Uncharacterized protein n=1 Tax=Potamilus streckersoni TaxID=2493646 RepID=A0AAE0SA02_9BIVA|nr:hypothetical protein CHS0354_012115 [Potamilus streckersoni]
MDYRRTTMPNGLQEEDYYARWTTGGLLCQMGYKRRSTMPDGLQEDYYAKWTTGGLLCQMGYQRRTTMPNGHLKQETVTQFIRVMDEGPGLRFLETKNEVENFVKFCSSKK